MTPTLKDLRNVNPRAITPLMEEEAAQWLRVLSWDYNATSAFLLSYLRRHLLPGFALLDGRRAVGYIYMVLEGGRGIIGNLYVARARWGSGLEERLVEAAVRELKSRPGVDRIETQLMLFSGADLERSFDAAGFESHRRHFLSLRLSEWGGGKPRPPELELRDWDNGMIGEAARVVFDSYQGGIDAHFSFNFSRREKCREFVVNLVQRDGCGRFLPKMTTVGFAGGRMAGVVIATELSSGTGHMPQISVAPDAQGNGIGSYLVGESLRRWGEAGYDAVSLTVTEENQRAENWYRRIGFEEVLAFNAYLWLRSWRHAGG